MKVLHVSVSDLAGGASRAAYRIHKSFDEIDGIESRMLVLDKVSGDWTVKSAGGTKGVIKRLLWSKFDQLYKRVLLQGKVLDGGMYSIHKLSYPELRQALFRSKADLIHLHFISSEMLSIEDIGKIEKPIIWTLHDMCAFSGGWHYYGDPSLKNLEHSFKSDSQRVVGRKQKAWKNLKLSVVCPSLWLKHQASTSAVFKKCPVSVIPYALSSSSFFMHDRSLAKKALGLPTEGQFIAFAAMSATSDKRKGYDHLKEALELARSMRKKIENNWHLLIFGASQPEQEEDLGLPVYYLGTLKDEASLSLAYSAADVFVAPSRQDNLPLTVQESLMCGTPVVAFEIGGMPDMITHQETGYLAQPYDAGELLMGIQWAVSQPIEMRNTCRSAACKMFDPEKVARAYLGLYQTVNVNEQ